jgi:hypothetical protein
MPHKQSFSLPVIYWRALHLGFFGKCFFAELNILAILQSSFTFYVKFLGVLHIK